MSRYTTQLRYIVDQKYSLINPGAVVASIPYFDRCRVAAPSIFDFTFPIWDEGQRLQFEVDFLVHFYFDEIGAETFGQWQVYLNDWLNTNMPYYNMLFKAIDLNYANLERMFENTVKEVYEGDGSKEGGRNTNENGSSSQEVEGSNNSMQKYYEVPSGNVTEITDHLNNALQVDGKGKSTTTGSNHRENNESENSTYNDAHTLTRTARNGSEITASMLKLISEKNNIKLRMYRQMAILFMGVL